MFCFADILSVVALVRPVTLSGLSDMERGRANDQCSEYVWVLIKNATWNAFHVGT